LRGLLARGEGLFWQRDAAGRIWLRGAGRVAASLAAGRLQGRPVALPLAVLLGRLGQLRAHCYAAFHSGRPAANPISRATIARLTGVPRRTQRAYECAAGVRARLNLAIGELYTPETAQERAWRHGRAVFRFFDWQGRHGPPGSTYLAWRLPNSYARCHRREAKGRQRKINRQIDLVNKRAQGNDRPARAGSPIAGRLFFANGAAAVKASGNRPEADAFWPPAGAAAGRAAVWRVIAAPADGL
jgi:hypothetical protein